MRLKRPSLLVTFGVMSLIPILVLGFVLTRALEDVTRRRNVERVVEDTRFITNISIAAILSQGKASAGGLSPAETIAMNDLFSRGGSDVLALRVFGPLGISLYSTTGTRSAPSDLTRAALAGREGYVVEKLGGVTALTVAVPFSLAPGLPPGAVEMSLKYDVITATSAKDARKLQLILAGGLLLLYLVLIPVVAQASRRLRRQSEENAYLARHDRLTGLGNRLLFENVLERSLTGAGGHGVTALMLLDVDHLKETNDTFGHPAGDVLLKAVAERVESAARQGDTVARIGGDELGILLARTRGASDLAEIAERVLASVSRPLDLGSGRTIVPSVSLGVAWAPTHGTTPAELLRSADTALYRAKREERGRFRFAGVAAA